MPSLEVTVVAATHDRQDRLARLLAGLRAQTVGAAAFEVVVVDDASSDGTPALLEREAAREGLRLRVIRRERSAGPAVARNAGWRAARAPLVAFTDDDCRPEPDWLEALLRAEREAGGRAIVQGAVDPEPEEADRLGPFSRSLTVTSAGPWFPTANILYPRDVLERHGGFDETTFTGPGGEDTDLAWRALRDGTSAAFAADARVHHAVHEHDALDKLRFATRWVETMAVFGRHPQLRREALVRGLFWKPAHYHLVRTLVAAALPRPLRLLALWCAWRYGVLLWQRATHPGDGAGGGPLLMPYYALFDAVETVTALRGGIRYRTPVL